MGAFDATYIKLYDKDHAASSRCLLACGDGRLYVAGSGGKLVVETLQEHGDTFDFDTLVYHGVFHHDDRDDNVCVLRFTINNKCVADTPDGGHVHFDFPDNDNLISDDPKSNYRGLYIQEDVPSEGAPRQNVFLQSASHIGHYLAFNVTKGVFLKCPADKNNDEELRFSVVMHPRARDASDFTSEYQTEDEQLLGYSDELHQHQVLNSRSGGGVAGSARTPQYVEVIRRFPTVELQNECLRLLEYRIDRLVSAGKSCVLWVVSAPGTAQPDVALIDVDVA